MKKIFTPFLTALALIAVFIAMRLGNLHRRKDTGNES